LLLMTKSLPEIRRLRAKGYNVGELRTPRGMSAKQHDMPWALDNDGFQGVDIPMWLRALGKVSNQEGCLFVLAPDVVSDARATMTLFSRYAPVIRDCGLPVGFALQNGEGVGVPWELLDAVFIGGDTEFKFSDKVRWLVSIAKERGKWVHMGRVNTLRRIEYAAAIGCDSIDGTKWSRFTNTYAHQLVALNQKQGVLA
jgi:hypothetical protein